MKYIKTELPSNKKFGLFFFSIFLFLGCYLFIKNYSIAASISISISMIFLFFSVFFPEKLLLLNIYWMRLGILIGKFVNPVVLGVVFFGLFVPLGLFIRLFNRDELSLKQKDTNSFWKNRESGKFKPNSFNKQF